MSAVVPGLVDIHVHGAHGLDVMNGQTNDLIRELRRIGVEYVCPTTVTAGVEATRRALAAIDVGATGFAGLHIEGPFISRDRPGAQPPEYIREASIEAFDDLVSGFKGKVAIVTLAPENPGAMALAAHLRARGILVSAGHTNATYEQLRGAPIDHMTHFYNAMRPFGHREPGAVGFGFEAEVTCELIYDRVHVSRTAAEVLWRLKKPSRMIAVSDGTMASGLADGWSGSMWGHDVVKRDGAVRLLDGTLAGSAVTLVDVFKFLWQDLGEDVAVATCSTNPRKALGLPDPRMWLRVSDDGTIIEVLEDR